MAAPQVGMTLGISRHLPNSCLLKQINPVFLAITDWVCPIFVLAVPASGAHSTPTVLTEQVAGGIVVPGSGRLVACLGVDDLVIVDMPDTLLVTTRARSQEVKRLVKKAKDAGWRRLL
jgi:hypothetical protein